MKYVGLFTMLIGISQIKSGNAGFMIATGFVILIGALGGLMAAIGATLLAVLLSTVHFFGGWVGVALAMVALAGFAVYATKFLKYGIPACEYHFGKIHNTVMVRQSISFPLIEILNQLYKKNIRPISQQESLSDFNIRVSSETFWGGYIEFEIDGVICDLKFAKAAVAQVELHRIILYSTSRRINPKKTKEIVEMKIKKFADQVINTRQGELVASVKCINRGAYKASLIPGKDYAIVNSMVCVCGVNFQQIIDESGDPYFYPQSLFTSSSLE